MVITKQYYIYKILRIYAGINLVKLNSDDDGDVSRNFGVTSSSSVSFKFFCII